MIVLASVCVASYLIGGIPFSYLAGRVTRGVDLREFGSGNLGATNTYRVLGGRVAIIVLLLDIAKGFMPVFTAMHWLPAGTIPVHWLGVAAMFFSILGHLFSPYLGFAGGKGIATSAGAFAALAPWAFLGAFVVFALVFAASRIVSLGSIFAALSLPVFVALSARFGFSTFEWSVEGVSILIMVIVLIKHRSNIQRLMSGTEKKLAKVKPE